VDQEYPTGFEPNNQILAPALDSLDALTFELGCDFLRLGWTRDARVEDGDALEPPPDQKRLKASADRLDLGQFRHGG